MLRIKNLHRKMNLIVSIYKVKFMSYPSFYAITTFWKICVEHGITNTQIYSSQQISSFIYTLDLEFILTCEFKMGLYTTYFINCFFFHQCDQGQFKDLKIYKDNFKILHIIIYVITILYICCIYIIEIHRDSNIFFSKIYK